MEGMDRGTPVRMLLVWAVAGDRKVIDGLVSSMAVRRSGGGMIEGESSSLSAHYSFYISLCASCSSPMQVVLLLFVLAWTGREKKGWREPSK